MSYLKPHANVQDEKRGYDLWMGLSGCMADSKVDWTVFFRLLSDYRPASDKSLTKLEDILAHGQRPLRGLPP